MPKTSPSTGYFQPGVSCLIGFVKLGNYASEESVEGVLNYANLAMQSSFRYGVIKNLMVQVVAQLQEAGHPDEAQAMLALTHVIGSRIEPIDTAHARGVDYQLECLTYQRDLLLYLTGPDQPLLPTN